VEQELKFHWGGSTGGCNRKSRSGKCFLGRFSARLGDEIKDSLSVDDGER
jgi:hypothetical protein